MCHFIRKAVRADLRVVRVSGSVRCGSSRSVCWRWWMSGGWNGFNGGTLVSWGCPSPVIVVVGGWNRFGNYVVQAISHFFGHGCLSGRAWLWSWAAEQWRWRRFHGGVVRFGAQGSVGERGQRWPWGRWVQWTSWTLGSRRDWWHGSRWVVIHGVFGAGHLVDLNVIGWEDAAATCSWNPALQPLIINSPGYADHLTLK